MHILTFVVVENLPPPELQQQQLLPPLQQSQPLLPSPSSVKQQFDMTLSKFLEEFKLLPATIPFHKEVVDWLGKVVEQYNKEPIPIAKIPIQEHLWTGDISCMYVLQHTIKEMSVNPHKPTYRGVNESIESDTNVEESNTSSSTSFTSWLGTMVELSTNPTTYKFKPEVLGSFGTVWEVAVSDSMWLDYNFREPSWFDDKVHKCAIHDSNSKWKFIIAPAGNITDLHIDPLTFTGFTSLFFGIKLWFFWPPTENNPKLVEDLIYCNPNKNNLSKELHCIQL